MSHLLWAHQFLIKTGVSPWSLLMVFLFGEWQDVLFRLNKPEHYGQWISEWRRHTHKKSTGKQPHLETPMNEGKQRASQLISIQNFKAFSLLWHHTVKKWSQRIHQTGYRLAWPPWILLSPFPNHLPSFSSPCFAFLPLISFLLINDWPSIRIFIRAI